MSQSEIDHEFVPIEPEARWLCWQVLETDDEGRPIRWCHVRADHHPHREVPMINPLEPRDGP